MRDELELLLFYLLVVLTRPVSNNVTESFGKMEIKQLKERNLLFFLHLIYEFTCTDPASTTKNIREHSNTKYSLIVKLIMRSK